MTLDLAYYSFQVRLVLLIEVFRRNKYFCHISHYFKWNEEITFSFSRTMIVLSHLVIVQGCYKKV